MVCIGQNVIVRLENANLLKKKNFCVACSAYLLGKPGEMASFKRSRVGFHNYSTSLCGLREKSFHNKPVLT